MSTGYGWEGLRQVCATLLGVRHVPERPYSGIVCLGRYNKCSPLPLTLTYYTTIYCFHFVPTQYTTTTTTHNYNNNNNDRIGHVLRHDRFPQEIVETRLTGKPTEGPRRVQLPSDVVDK